MKDTIKILKSLKKYDLLMKLIRETIENVSK